MPADIAPHCGHPCRPSRQRRGLCKTCYRKLGEANCLPPPGAQGRPHVSPLRRWVETLTAGQRVDLFQALTGVEG